MLILLLVVLACGSEDAQQAAPFRIGVMESLTGPGETYGTMANQVKQMAADEINASGGINGRRLEFVSKTPSAAQTGQSPPTRS